MTRLVHRRMLKYPIPLPVTQTTEVKKATLEELDKLVEATTSIEKKLKGMRKKDAEGYRAHYKILINRIEYVKKQFTNNELEKRTSAL